MEEADIVCGLVALSADGLIDAASASINRTVLGSHDDLKSALRLYVAGEARQLRNAHDNLHH